MKRAVILSDSHGDETGLRWMLEQLWKTCGPVDLYLHLGDGARDFQRLENFLLARDPHCVPMGVAGNCDFGAQDVPETRLARLGTAGLMMTHGHRYQVKQSLAWVEAAARERGCEAALFGHTHRPLCEQRGVLLLNPGSAADGHLAVLECDDGGRLAARLLAF